MTNIINIEKIVKKKREAEKAELKAKIVSAMSFANFKKLTLHMFEEMMERIDFAESYILEYGIGTKKVEKTLLKILRERGMVDKNEIVDLFIKRLRKDLKF